MGCERGATRNAMLVKEVSSMCLIASQPPTSSLHQKNSDWDRLATQEPHAASAVPPEARAAGVCCGPAGERKHSWLSLCLFEVAPLHSACPTIAKFVFNFLSGYFLTLGLPLQLSPLLGRLCGGPFTGRTLGFPL